ncbi:MAG: UvrD-helicase domain-containing protein [Deltaproteobacteria bacterium]|nr:UvrD-helicase domain-containing protein [Deltaproteobacteria bacterium]
MSEDVVSKETELEFPHVFQLAASAGSGKTHSLSLRYVQFLLSDSGKILNKNLRSILAITFTNKTANEMKERILRQLKLIAIPALKDDKQAAEREQILKQLKSINLGDKNFQKATDKLVEEIIRHYTDFQVRTIDSFLRSIIVASLRETNLQPDFDIAIDAMPYIEYAVDDLLSRIQTNPAVKELFIRFLDIYLNVEGKTGFYPREDIINLVNRFRYLENKKCKRIESKKITREEIDKKKYTFKKAVNNLYDIIAEENIETKYLPGKDDLIGKIDSNDFSNKLWVQHDVEYILKKQSKHFRDQLQHAWDNIRWLLFDLLITVDSSRYSAYHDILINIEKTLHEITQARGEILIDDINKYVKELTDKYNVPEIYFNLGERIFHYFIDEFQDTDRAQWNNIKDLLMEALSNGGSLFYVGDKKQSIYRFKGSDSSLFDEVIEDEGIVHILKGIYIKQLSSNYRSTALLVNFFNETFHPDYLKRMIVDNEKEQIKLRINKQIIELINDTYKGSGQAVAQNNKTQKQGGYVLVEHIESKDEQSNADASTPPDADAVEPAQDEDVYIKRIDEVIVDLHDKGTAYSDIAVLVRKNEQIEALSGKLKQKSIPVQSVQGLDIRKHHLIDEVISFLSFLNNPLDNLSFAGFITGEIFNTVSGIQTNDMHAWFVKQRGSKYLYIAFKQWQVQLWDEFIRPLFNAVGYLPAYDIVNEFIERFNVHENFSTSIGFFMHLLEMLKKREDKGENNLYSFLEYWNTKEENDNSFFVNLSSGDAVKILTIHKAKGLEFPVVILPSVSFVSLNPKSKGNDQQSMFITEDNDKLNLSYSNKMHRSILNSINEEDPSIKAYIKDQALSFIDELNTFYVALTRAGQELYIFIQDEKDPVYTLFEHKLDTNGRYEQGEHIVLKKQGKEEEDVFTAKVRASTRWQDHIFIKQPDMDSLENYKEEKRGNIIHDILSRITIVDEHIGKRISGLLDMIKNETIKNQSDIIDKLTEVLTSEEVKAWFTPGRSANVFKEKEIVNKHGELKRIDRLIVTQDEAIIVDYKTGGLKDIEKHKKQVRGYMNIISDIYPTRRIKGYLLYVDHNRVEEVR